MKRLTINGELKEPEWQLAKQTEDQAIAKISF
jgi:hypothetical protein